MIHIDAIDDTIYFENINKLDYPKILSWYNDIEEYKFATGIDKPIKIDKLHKKYQEVFISENEFFIGIYLKNTDICIGVARGGINNNFKDGLWINSIIIDKKYQRKGYGTRCMNLIIKYFEHHYGIIHTYISVVQKNTKAINFWSKLGFEMLRKMNNHLVIDNEKQDVVIMIKKLNSCII